MAGPVSSNQQLRPQPPRQQWLNDSRREAVIKSSDMLRDRFDRTSSTVSSLDRTFSDPAATTMARTAAVGSSVRELGNTLKTVDTLNQQLDMVLGDSPTYQHLKTSQAGKAFVNTTRATVRTVAPVADTAGAIADLTNSQTMAAQDIAEMQRTLANPQATTAMKIAASAKATQSASNYVRQQQITLRAIEAADADYLSNPTYQRLTQGMRQSTTVRMMAKVNGMVSPRVMTTAQVAGTAAGAVLGVITLPKLVEAVGSTYQNLKITLHNPGATQDQKLDAVADLSRASAGTIQGVEGLRLSAVGLDELASNSRLLGGLMTKVHSVGAFAEAGSWFTRIMKVISPVADVGMFIADGVKLKHTFSDPRATVWTKARAILNVGLDGLKLASWLMPQTAALRLAYMGVSFAQLGLATYDLGHSVGPTLAKWGHASVEGVLHPQQALHDLGQNIGKGMSFVSNHVYAAASALEYGVLHPVKGVEAIGHEAAHLFASAKELGGVLKDSATVVNDSAKGATTPTTPAPAPAAAPVANPANVPSSPAPVSTGTTATAIGALPAVS